MVSPESGAWKKGRRLQLESVSDPSVREAKRATAGARRMDAPAYPGPQRGPDVAPTAATTRRSAAPYDS